MRLISSVLFGFVAGWICFAIGIEISGAMQTHRNLAGTFIARDTWWFMLASLRFFVYLLIPPLVAIIFGRLAFVARVLLAATAGCIAGIVIGNHAGIMSFFP